MKSDTMFTIKIALIAVLMVAIQSIAAFAMISGVRSGLVRSREETLRWNIGALASSYGGTLADYAGRASRWDGVSEGPFTARGSLREGNISFGRGETLLSALVAENLERYAFSVYSAHEVGFDGGSEGEFLVYCSPEGEERKVVLQTQEQFLRGLPSYGYTHAALLNDGGRILTGEDAGKRLADLLSAAPEEVLTGETVFREMKFEDTPVLFASAPLSFGDRNLYVAGWVDAAASNAVLEEEAGRTILIVVLVCTATTALLAAFLLVFLLRDRRQRLAAGSAYEIVCDGLGNIVRSNAAFRKLFECRNIFDEINIPPEELGDGLNMVVPLYDRLGQEHSVGFSVKKGKDFYSLEGRELLMNKNEEGVRSFGMQRSVDLRADYKRLTAERLLVGMIEITNLSTLESMFGKVFCEKVYYAVSEKVKRRFSSFYAMIPDQIGILIGDSKEMDECMRDMPQIMDELNRPVRIEENLINAVCRAGFAIVDAAMEDRSVDYALACSKAALKKSAHEDRQSYYIYHETQRKQYQKYFEITCDIRRLLEENSFELEFQPQFSLKTGKVSGFESLFRIKKHLSLEINIQDLINYAERSGNMILLGNFIFGEGMAFAKSVEGSGVTVSLNVSPVQLMQAGFVENFLSIYRKYDLKPGSICIEITETFLMTDFDETLSKLRLLKEQGIGIHLDDFGVNYSSLLYLKRLPITALKIDREFIIDVEKNDYSRAITTFIVQLSKQLGIECICEGVEFEGQKKILAELGCDAVQGYLTGRSMPAEAARALLNKN